MPLKKTAIPSAALNFRPIDLLTFLSKVLDKIVHEQISLYLDSKKFLTLIKLAFVNITLRKQHYSD